MLEYLINLLLVSAIIWFSIGLLKAVRLDYSGSWKVLLKDLPLTVLYGPANRKNEKTSNV